MVPRFTRGVLPTPKKQLLDFERVHVLKNSSVILSFTIAETQLELVTEAGGRDKYDGVYTIMFTNGAGASDSHNITVV